ncbi:MAG: ABC transporter ATP-binding protein [Phycisphaerae bacterium]|nr:ABC transporter ATP-binding protein [Phycisphaerae bacterium]
MESTIISVQSVSKFFQRGERCDSLYGAVARRFRQPIGHAQGGVNGKFRALEDISFDVVRGECFGIIGHNGAGKSTMLKLLAGIMRPDEGCVAIDGRVSALIEVGAGFHPMLTGRENVYLNAAILGMSRSEARRLFDEIVEFAGVREHIDMPVKHYSSGMYARLGFSIAAHVDPDVLLVDEVLSVGDAQFRSRCIDRMRAFLKRGVSIVFVSHDLGTVQQFCHRSMVLAEGRSSFIGASPEAVAQYHRSYSSTLLVRDAQGRPTAHLSCIRLRTSQEAGAGSAGSAEHCAVPGETVVLEFDVAFEAHVPNPSIGLSIVRTRDWLTVYETSSARLGVSLAAVSAGDRMRFRCRFDLNVSPGEYAIGLHVRDRDGLQYLVEEVDAVRVRVTGSLTGATAHLDFQQVAVRTDSNDRDLAGAFTSSRGAIEAGSPSRSC